MCTQVHIEFTDEHDHIRIEGPPDDVELAKTELDSIIKDLVCFIPSLLPPPLSPPLPFPPPPPPTSPRQARLLTPTRINLLGHPSLT